MPYTATMVLLMSFVSPQDLIRYSSSEVNIDASDDTNIPCSSSTQPPATTRDWFTIFMEQLNVPSAKLYTMESPLPDLIYSMSPSPSPSRDLGPPRTPSDMKSLTPLSSPPQNHDPSPLAQVGAAELFFPVPANVQKSPSWDFISEDCASRAYFLSYDT